MVSVYDAVRNERKLHCWRRCCACHCARCVVLLRHSLDLESVASGPNEIEMQEWQSYVPSESKRVLIMRIMGGITVLVVGLSCNLACDQPQTVIMSQIPFLLRKRMVACRNLFWRAATACCEPFEYRPVAISMSSTGHWESARWFCLPLIT